MRWMVQCVRLCQHDLHVCSCKVRFNVHIVHGLAAWRATCRHRCGFTRCHSVELSSLKLYGSSDKDIADLVPHTARWMSDSRGCAWCIEIPSKDSDLQKAVELLGSYPHVVFPPTQIPSAARTDENPRPHAVFRLTPVG